MIRRLAMMSLAVLLIGGLPARAEDDPQPGTGYLELYPSGDIYRTIVIGDGLAEGLLGGMTDAFRGDQRLQLKPKTLELDSLMRPGFAEQVKALDDALAREPVSVALVMLGPQDRVSIRNQQGRRIWIDSEDWKTEFGRQIDTVMKTLKRRKIGVYWVSLPNVRRAEPNEDVQVLNEIIRERAYLNGLKYIDAYTGFADEGGGYSAMGPDITGKIRLLREQNGVNFTDAGNRKLAHFVERELRRDLSQAKADRTIPLAGSEAEQAAIDANRQPAAKAAKPGEPAGTSVATPGAPASGTSSESSSGQVLATASNGDQKADSGRISLSVPGAGGREDVVAVDLLRPSIPATVIALVNRKENSEKPTQLGDLIIDQIAGGVMIMSSITPATDPSTGDARRRLAPTQTPYFRVMVKGERVASRPGRADDVSWPRSEPPPPEAPAVKPPVADVPAKPPVNAAKSKVKRQQQTPD